jgi:chlorobactene glucosyltransferase
MFSGLLIYQLLILSVLLVLLGLVCVNLRTLPRIQYGKLPGHTPRSAVLVPARNEEANIEGCLRSLLAQDYPNYEVWVYDDASMDATGKIAAKLAREDPHGSRLHIVTGRGDPPPGWLGKAHACHRLSETVFAQSDPDYLLFTDADVRHAPEALRQTVMTAQATGAGLLSIFPRQITVSWAERLAVPLMQHWAVYGILPLPLAFDLRTGPAFAAANGQFMLFTREAYQACGGHAGVRDKVLEDVELARAVKRAGYRTMLADGGPLVLARMYAGRDEVWRGYSKNSYAFFGYSPLFLTLGVVALLVLYVVPPIVAFYALAVGEITWELLYLPLLQYVTAVTTRLALALRFATRLLDAYLHPIAVLFLITILANSMRWALTGKGSWKGRTYLEKH